LGLEEEASAVETAVSHILAAGHRTADIAKPGEATVGTQAMGDLIVAHL
jgi:3-isopropylmalate dehydrogenase